MGIHKYDKNMKNDDQFIEGDICYLVEGNRCRLLDGRRTTGVIEKYFEESGIFRWRITKYEDEGKYWDLPAEDIIKFQFEKDSKKLRMTEVKQIQKKIEPFQKTIRIEAHKSDREKTEEEIQVTKKEIKEWLENKSLFFNDREKLKFSSNEGSMLLAKDLINYMKSVDFEEEEKRTAESMVLNPNSGEWIKGLSIVLAEMGLVPYEGKIPRTRDIFEGMGSKKNRARYIINRLAFIRAYFSLLNMHEVVLYRGMSSEHSWRDITRTFLSCTFSLEVAQAFSDFNPESKYKTSYLIKMPCAVNQLFMTYIETEAMNRQYKEAEALLLYDQSITL